MAGVLEVLGVILAAFIVGYGTSSIICRRAKLQEPPSQ